MELDKTELALASYVALRMDDYRQEHGCPAWVESRGEQCGRKPFKEDGALCKRHRTVASNRHQKSVEKFQQQQARRKAYQQAKLPEWTAELEKVEADIQRYGSLDIDDPAATRGYTHPSIRRKQMNLFSDTNVQRMARLTRRAQELQELIAAATR